MRHGYFQGRQGHDQGDSDSIDGEINMIREEDMNMISKTGTGSMETASGSKRHKQGWVSSGRNYFLPFRAEERVYSGRNWKKLEEMEDMEETRKNWLQCWIKVLWFMNQSSMYTITLPSSALFFGHYFIYFIFI